MIEHLMDFLTRKIPIGEAVSNLVDFMMINFGEQFRMFSSLLEGFIKQLGWALSGLHPLLLIAIFTIISWFLRKSKAVSLFCLLGFILILNLGLWTEMIETLALILTATILSGVSHFLHIGFDDIAIPPEDA